MSNANRTPRRVPTFKTEAEERRYWKTHDSTEFIDWSKARAVQFPNLRPSTTAISVRLPDTLLTELKLLANERDVPYQSLLKLYLADRVREERKADRAREVATAPRSTFRKRRAR